MSDVSLEKLSLLERLAELEHIQWSHWMEYQRKQKELAWLDYLKDTGKPQFDSNVMERWILLSRTPYDKLTEKEKESDREWARKALAIFKEELRVSATKISKKTKKLVMDFDPSNPKGITPEYIAGYEQACEDCLKELVEPEEDEQK